MTLRKDPPLRTEAPIEAWGGWEPVPGSLMRTTRGDIDVIFVGWTAGDDAPSLHDGFEHLGKAYEAVPVFRTLDDPFTLYLRHWSRIEPIYEDSYVADDE